MNDDSNQPNNQQDDSTVRPPEQSPPPFQAPFRVLSYFEGRWTGLLVVVLVFGVVGAVTLFTSFAATPTQSLFGPSVVPTTPSDPDSQAVELGVKFQSTTAGTISGIRYYKSSDNTGSHSGTLWSADGTKLASASFSNETDSGWQQVNFSSPITITPHTTYVASYHTNSGHYADDTGGFPASNSTDLTILNDGQSGPNGVYAYGSGSRFPTNGWQASNYYVDVIFNPGATGTTPPPATGGTGSTAGSGSSGGTTSTGSLAVDKQVTTHGSTPSSNLTSPSFSTSKPNELILAFIASDGPNKSNGQSFKVKGGGLSWSLRKRSNGQAGDAEIWQAIAANPLNNVQVKASRMNGKYDGSLTVVSFSGANTTSNGVVAAASAANGAPKVSLKTTANGSWVWGVANDWDKAIARTVPAGQVKVDEYLPPVGDTYWLQNSQSTTPNSGTTVVLNDTAPTTDRWNYAAIEIVPSGVSGGGGPTTAPSDPTNLSVTAASQTTINLTWSSGSNASSYQVYRDGSAIGNAVTGTSYADTGLTPSTAYTYQVQALGSTGLVSNFSNSASATTAAPTTNTGPAAPTNLTATAPSSTEVDLNWAASSGASQYSVVRDGIVIQSGITTTNYKDTTVAAGTSYSYDVVAQDANNTSSAPSSNVSVTSPTVVDTTKPGAPTNLVSTSVTDTQVNLSWSPSTDNIAIASYNVYRDGTLIGSVTDITNTSYGDGTVNANTKYSYSVTAVDGNNNESAKSNSVSVTTLPTPTPPPNGGGGGGGTVPPVSGQFSVSGSTIVDPFGKQFVPVGDNVNGKDWVWDQPTIGESAAAKGAWHWNAIRLNTCEQGVDNQECGNFGGVPQSGWHTNDDLTAIVNEYTAQHIVVILDNLHAPNLDGSFCSNQAACNDYWKAEAAQYANNPYVWFELQNEPGGTGADVSTGSQWYQTQTQMAAAVRSSAPNNIIVMDGAQFGQDNSENGCDGWDLGASAIYNDGAGIESAYHNVVFAWHAYSSTANTGCSASQAQARITGYVNAVKGTGIPIIMDEMGYGNCDYCSQAAFDGVMSVAQQLGLGVLLWHGSENNGFFPQANTTWFNVTDPSQLLPEGQALWDYAHNNPYYGGG